MYFGLLPICSGLPKTDRSWTEALRTNRRRICPIYAPATIARYRPAIVSYLKWLVRVQCIKTYAAVGQTGFDAGAAYLNTWPVQSAAKRNQTIAALSATSSLV
jgi:hypothetical protein